MARDILSGDEFNKEVVDLLLNQGKLERWRTVLFLLLVDRV